MKILHIINRLDICKTDSKYLITTQNCISDLQKDIIKDEFSNYDGLSLLFIFLLLGLVVIAVLAIISKLTK